MKEQTINLWDTTGDAICITTNGVINHLGLAIMGGGVALEAVTRYPEMAEELGYLLQLQGNHVYLLQEAKPVGLAPFAIFSFPTKTHPYMKSDPLLIVRSARELISLCDDYGYEDIYIPRPGCGLGGLDWEDVKPLLSEILDDRFTVVTT